MSAFTNAIDSINRKKAGMFILCNTFASNLENQAKQSANWKDRTSHARQGINGESLKEGNHFRISLSHGVEYGEILEKGSKPHIIRPKNKQALYWRGASHPVKFVNHPGTKGFKTLETTVESNISNIKTTVINYWSD